MIFSLLYVLIFALSGVYIADAVFSQKKAKHRLWFGLVFGLFLWTWLPSLFAFLIGFTLLSQLLALGSVVLIGGYFALKAKGRLLHARTRPLKLWPLLVLSAIFVLGVSLFLSHIIRPGSEGYYVGQVTYGDLSMHLGFISSIAEQGVFPPAYSIFPGQTINYPFLCETSASTLVLLGSSLRQAYLISAIYAYALVILGAYYLFEAWLKRRGTSILALLLFFFGGGFGFIYFFDRLKADATTLVALLDRTGQTNWQVWLDGFYQTPTNIPELGLRWVNPLVDMLIPQRATLVGWAILFPCLYLLYGWFIERKKENLIPLGILAGGLPLIHTHSFLALGIISAAYFIYELMFVLDRKRIVGWLRYGVIAVLLALPQLIFFTFTQVKESQMLKFHLNWANQQDGVLWFYLKNFGWLFIFFVPALLSLSTRDRKVMLGPLFLWLISEFVLFQPNVYDNNKLLFVSFFFITGLIARFVASTYRAANRYLLRSVKRRWKRTWRDADLASRDETILTFSVASLLLAASGAIYWFIKIVWPPRDSIELPLSTIFSLLSVLFFLIWLLIKKAIEVWRKKTRPLHYFLSGLSVLSVILSALLLLHKLFSHYAFDVIDVSRGFSYVMLSLMLCVVAFEAFTSIRIKRGGVYAASLKRLALSLTLAFFALTTFLSATMTIVRETRSEYLAFNHEEIAAATYIAQNTPPTSLFLTDANWHFNTVASLSGRNIVVGSDTYLHFHGIDARERRADVKRMLEEPQSNLDLYRQYDVAYVFIGDTERRHYDVDEAYFSQHFRKTYSSERITIFQIPIE